MKIIFSPSKEMREENIFENKKIEFTESKFKDKTNILIGILKEKSLSEIENINDVIVTKRKLNGNQQDIAIRLNEKQQKEWQANNVYEIQNRFDIEASEREIRSYRIYITCLALVLVLSVITLVLYHKYKVAKAKRSILEKRLLISEYSDRIDQFKVSQTEANKELNSLRQRVNNLKDKELKVLSNGKLLYESILQNHSTVHWSTNDFADFIEYFKFADPTFMLSLDNTYNNLSTRQYLFLIVTGKLGKSETDAGDILGISPGSVRAFKSRPQTKKKPIKMGFSR